MRWFASTPPIRESNTKHICSRSRLSLFRRPTVGPVCSCLGHLKRLERLGRGREQICLECSATLEAFGAVRKLSVQTQHAKSEEEGCRTSEPLDSLIGGVLANQRDVWEGRNTVCALVFYALRSVIPYSHVLQYWHETSGYVRLGRINLYCLAACLVCSGFIWNS